MFRLFIPALFATLLSACGGVLAYQQGDTVRSGPLDDMNLNQMKSSGALRSQGAFDDIEYAIDPGGRFVGICRTRFHSAPTAGDMDLAVYNALRQKTIEVSQKQLATRIDDFTGTPAYAPRVASRPHIYLHCYRMGAGKDDGELVAYLQPQGIEGPPPDAAVELDVSGAELKVLDVEFFPRTAAPSRVIARDNPLNGNSVAVVNGVIEINGAPVRLNGTPVQADTVKHQFE